MNKFLKNFGCFISVACLICVGYYVYQYNAVGVITINNNNVVIFTLLCLLIVFNSIMSVVFILMLNKVEKSLLDVIEHVDDVEDNLVNCSRDTQTIVIDLVKQLKESKGKENDKECKIKQEH